MAEACCGGSRSSLLQPPFLPPGLKALLSCPFPQPFLPRADVARTPAERGAVDWDAVIADAQNGITSDHFNTTNVTNGPFNGIVNQLYRLLEVKLV